MEIKALEKINNATLTLKKGATATVQSRIGKELIDSKKAEEVKGK